MSQRLRMADIAALGLLAGVALVMGVSMHPLAVDDAFITYRYAQNLASGYGFTYNVGQPVLSTTAPLYALVLSAGAFLGASVPALGNALSALALYVAATLTYALGRRERTPWLGALAATALVLQPLLWLCLGMETAVLLALALGAILSYRSGRPYWTAVLLALTTLTRGDGLILTAVIAADYALGRLRERPGVRGDGKQAAASGPWRPALGAAGLYLVILLPLALWLTWRFGSPVPASLRAKIAQAELGVTGFYPHTTYLQGIGVLVRARLAQSRLYLLVVPAVVVGLVAMWKRAPWVRLVVAWGRPTLSAMRCWVPRHMSGTMHPLPWP